MQSIQDDGFDDLDRALAKLLKEAPQKKRELHTELAGLLKTETDKNISGSINDSHGHIKGWQEKIIGPGGNYAAVRAVSTSSGKNSPGAITNYLENGHRIRHASGSARRKRRSRAKLAFVDGRHFYQKTAADIEAPAIKLAEKFVEDMARKLEG